ncbi:MAG: hypothetical protein ACN6O8_00670 [Achromobacter sp.]
MKNTVPPAPENDAATALKTGAMKKPPAQVRGGFFMAPDRGREGWIRRR